MKKLLTVAAVLMAAALIFTGCKNAANSDDGDDLPGSWKSELSYYSGSANEETCGGTVTEDGKGGAIYENSTPTQPDPNNLIEEKHYRSASWAFAEDNNLTGFEATVKNTSSNSTYGFTWNVSDDWKDRYDITFEYQGFRIDKKINGSWSTITEWTNNTAIKNEPAENTVAIYKDGDNNVIKVNGTTIYTIKNPELTSGMIGFSTAVGYEDIAEQKGYTITYKLLQAQYEE